MAAIKISSLKNSTFASMETRNSPLVTQVCKGGLAPNNLSGYGNPISTNRNITESLPRAKIRIPKKSAKYNSNSHNKGHNGLDESLFVRNGNDYLTTREIIEDAHTLRLERNYSYIEAMKEDMPQVLGIPTKKGDIVSQNGNKVELGKPPLSIPSSSPSASSSTSSASSTMSQKQRTPNKQANGVSVKNVNDSPKTPLKSNRNHSANAHNNTSNLSKSASQSSILTIFKNTFSPFAIRKWRSKSRDKIIQKPELSTFDANGGNPTLPAARPTSPELFSTKKHSHTSIRNSHMEQKHQHKAPPLPVNPPFELTQQLDLANINKFQKNQLTPNQIKLRPKSSTSNKKTMEDNEITLTNGNQVNSIKPAQVETTVRPAGQILAPESPRSFLTNATNKSKTTTATTDSSMSSSLSSSDSSFALPCSNTQVKVQAPPPAVTSSLNQINSFLNNLSPSLSQQPRQKSERINLTCLLNGYISHNDDLFNSQSTNSISTNLTQMRQNNSYRTTTTTTNKDSSYSYSSNRDSMNKSADVLTSARYYDLKKKVFATTTANHKSNDKVSQLEDRQHENTKINTNDIESTIEAKILPKSEEGEAIKKTSENKAEDLKLNGNTSKTLDVVVVDTEQSSLKISNEDSTKRMSNSTPQQQAVIESKATTQTELIESDDSVKDGSYYLKLLDQETKNLNALCDAFKKYTEPSNVEDYVTNEESLGEIQTAIGKAQLLINQKFKQFRGLCVKNLSDKTGYIEQKEGEFVTLDGDLAGFWDMVCLQIDDIHSLFTKLEEMKANNWEFVRPKPKTVVKRTENKKPLVNNSNKVPSSKGTDAARQRLIEAKRKAAALKLKNQNNDIEIFE